MVNQIIDCSFTLIIVPDILGLYPKRTYGMYNNWKIKEGSLLSDYG